MKKPALLVLAIAAVLAISVALVGCGSSSSSSSSSSDDTMKVGCIYLGSANDGCFTQVMDKSIEAAKANLEAQGTKVELMKNENTADDKQTVTNVATNMIDNGCTVIIGCSFGFGEGLNELANSGDYDDITFLHFSGIYQNEKNLENFFGSMEEARYVTGMAAAAASTTGKLGYVAAFPYTEVQIGINAFALGAQAVNPDIDVQVVYINTWGDADKERAAAEVLIGEGCDVLAYHADSTTVQDAANKAGVYAIGWNLNNNVIGDNYVTAAYWDFSNYFTQRLTDIKAGTFKPTGTTPFSTYGSMGDGMINIDTIGSMVSDDAKSVIEAAQATLKSGDLKVFSGEIKYADGTTLCAAGQTLTDAEIWSINNVVAGVTATSSDK